MSEKERDRLERELRKDPGYTFNEAQGQGVTGSPGEFFRGGWKQILFNIAVLAFVILAFTLLTRWFTG
ncbi:hypothetical protein DRW41_10010 [Neobacillus piezotolerans]|uniref:Uncharacterized protein n=1 Tax=Neobacillus piezotolerans TaxID=2259171 RepID=A0A3D8GRF9_9BACI|nr:hypothetical protein [Neobacillus piezotolerans]RDU37018.1 hypothetical protein DRW41_10010 [Neobacillus piezotolerans]